MRLTFIGLVCLAYLLTSCENDQVPSGVDLKVYYSECPDSGSTPDYIPYNGFVYYIPAKEFIRITPLSWDSLKNLYTKTICEEGITSSFLSPGDYIIEPDSFLNALSPETIVITPDVLLEAEYYLLECQ